MADEYFSLVCDDVPHDVVLTDPGVRVLEVAQVVRRLTGLSLWRGNATAAVVSLRDAGARAETREQSGPGFRRS
ncbi:50S ribosomal protein L7/L12 [Streptomyces humi]|uniref:50S ribosomal protein L7/L12 n=1 Tax=Streptomyces humi TaxID=1428620 RepID=UPI0006289903|nr:50S ribosomal protein L7/L12 [Streptomyces humi]